jgi:hypothetical protein
VAPAVISITPLMGLNFALYETSKSILQSNRLRQNHLSHGYSTDSLTITEKGICGGLAGGLFYWIRVLMSFNRDLEIAISKFCVYPFDTIKKRLQIQVSNF